jgi:hypothetical protein
LERRGAGEVVAIDLADPERQDSPVSEPVQGPYSQPRRGGTFRVAAELVGSRAEYRDLSVYDLDPRDAGEFDLIVMSYVLQMLRDPLRGLEAVRPRVLGARAMYAVGARGRSAAARARPMQS